MLSTYYIVKLVSELEEPSIDKLAMAIIESKNEAYIQKFRKLPKIPSNFDNMIERARLEEITDEGKIKILLDNIYYKNIDSIEYNADIYRKLFVDSEEELIALDKEIKHKKRVLTPQSVKEQDKPQFPGIERKHNE